jgi:hypothetical protein
VQFPPKMAKGRPFRYSLCISIAVIPGSFLRAGSRAYALQNRLLIRQVTTGGAIHSVELVLDLFSVTIDGK